jgi:hypothetical protein
LKNAVCQEDTVSGNEDDKENGAKRSNQTTRAALAIERETSFNNAPISVGEGVCRPRLNIHA